MNLDKIPLGANPPHEFNVIVEIPQGGYPVKYEMEKESGAMYVDRFLNTAMTYPANYGFIPHTMAADGDPCDVLVLDRSPVVPGAVIRARPIGALVMTDEAGADDKIIAVPIDSLNPYYGWVQSPDDLPQVQKDQIAHFFQHYKDLEKGKWVAGLHWVGFDEALQLVRDGMASGKRAATKSNSKKKPASATKTAAAKGTARKKSGELQKSPPKAANGAKSRSKKSS